MGALFCNDDKLKYMYGRPSPCGCGYKSHSMSTALIQLLRFLLKG